MTHTRQVTNCEKIHWLNVGCMTCCCKYLHIQDENKFKRSIYKEMKDNLDNTFDYHRKGMDSWTRTKKICLPIFFFIMFLSKHGTNLHYSYIQSPQIIYYLYTVNPLQMEYTCTVILFYFYRWLLKGNRIKKGQIQDWQNHKNSLFMINLNSRRNEGQCKKCFWTVASSTDYSFQFYG